MKIRSGFVSNSSSSSYIIGVGKVIDEALLNEYCKTNHIDAEIYTVKEIMEDSNRWNSLKEVRDNKVYFKEEAFDCNEVSIEIDPTKLEDKYVKVYHCEDIEEDSDGDTDYDVDPDDFDDVGQAIFGMTAEQGVDGWVDTYGAGRNG